MVILAALFSKVMKKGFFLLLDFVASALLAASPFLFGFWHQAPNVWLPHLIAGIGVILLVLVSQTQVQAKARALA